MLNSRNGRGRYRRVLQGSVEDRSVVLLILADKVRCGFFGLSRKAAIFTSALLNFNLSITFRGLGLQICLRKTPISFAREWEARSMCISPRHNALGQNLEKS
jgi:hypothetical protein